MQENTMGLKDGRKLGYWIYGDKRGLPVFLLHGTPGSRIWFLEDDEVSKKLGIKLITTDRPGFGLSDAKKDRTIMDYAKDIEELADYLEIEEFVIAGVSGGGAYASAVAYCMPKRVRQCVLISTATPFENEKPPKDMAKENRMAFFFSKYVPWLINIANKEQKKMMDNAPEKYKEMMIKGSKHLSNWDREMLRDKNAMETAVKHAKEANRQGVSEILNESRLLMKEWGFRLSDIEVPVQIWHGEKDTLSPISEVRKTERKLKNVETNYITNGGHFLTEKDELWEKMLLEIKKKIEKK